MSSPGPLPTASFPIPPPLFRLPWVQKNEQTGTYILTTPAASFLTQLWAALQGSGGIIPAFFVITLPVAGFVTAYDAVAINAIGQAIAPDNTVISDGLSIVGLATSTASSGSSVNIQPFGLVTNPDWAWTAGDIVWCGNGGVLTQTPTTGAGNWIRRMGVASSTTSIILNIGEFVELT